MSSAEFDGLVDIAETVRAYLPHSVAYKISSKAKAGANKIQELEKQLNTANANACSQAAVCGKRIKELEKALQYFVDRVEDGTIRSYTTYSKFKKLLTPPAKENK